jgi:hypothetical protein
MASNEMPDNRAKLRTLAADMIDGLHDHEAAVGVKQNTEAKLSALLAASRTKQVLFQQAEEAEDTATAALKIANSNAKGFIATARRMLADEFEQAEPAMEGRRLADGHDRHARDASGPHRSAR